MANNRKAMCSLSPAVDAASSVALFSARRAGPAGRKGDRVGTCISMLSDHTLDPDEVAADMLVRLDGFLATVSAAPA